MSTFKEANVKCNQCHSDDIKVIESRDVAEGQAIRRRRMCVACGQRFTTYERLERPQLIIIKNDGTRELFNRTKLMAGLYRACEKTPVTSLQLEDVVNSVEQDLYACGEQEVRSNKVGELVMDKLARLNEVAYVRFASVYRRFKDIASFERELSMVRQGKHIAEPAEASSAKIKN
ncbi:MAG TPA: transcriptional regulator NrdR [Candidatus Saccharimonadales bacterium]|nr:transcriptional regulator NrdR [Candidatus Saccharimonadales bacterium]